MRLYQRRPKRVNPNQHRASDMRLRGQWLVLARMACGAGALLAIGLLTSSLLMRFAHLSSLSTFDVPRGWSTETLRAALAQLGLSAGFYHLYRIVLDLVFVLCFFLVAAMLLWHKSNEWMALFVALFLITFGAVWPVNIDALAALYPAWSWLFAMMDQLSFTFLLTFFLLFPDGRFVPRWMSWLLVVWVASGVLWLVFPSLPNWLNLLPFLSFLASALFAQMYRYRHLSNSVQRQQIKWVVFGFSTTLSAIFGLLALEAIFPSLGQPGVAGLLYALAGATLGNILFLPLPLSVGMALLRYRLWEIDILISRTLVYGTLTACIVGIYVLVVGFLGTLFHASSNLLISLLATGLVAVLFQPLRGRFQRGVNHLLYGQRDEPYAVISRLGQRLEGTLASHAVLPAIVETVAQVLKLPYAAVSLKQGDEFRMAAAYGSPVETPLSQPLAYQGEVIGQLLLAPRNPGEPLTPPDRRLLDDLARQIGIAAHAVRLTDDLQRSRERLVTAREEERRRLRRDLHDGLGPTLAALALKATTISDLIPTDPTAATHLSNELYADIRATVGEIRRLVYALRPPALDDLGLVAAIRERAAQYGHPSQAGAGSHHADGLRIIVEAPDRLPPLPAAVEVAAYRIVQEALTNVIRHAQAHTCTVHLQLSDTLQIEVSDDGVGFPSERQAGVGLLSMRERAAELGGSCVMESLPGAGVHMCARLPIPKEETDGTAPHPDR